VYTDGSKHLDRFVFEDSFGLGYRAKVYDGKVQALTGSFKALHPQDTIKRIYFFADNDVAIRGN